MAVAIEFCLLGPLRVRVDGAVVPVPPGKQRVLLAALLLQASRTVTAEQLAELLWGSALPPSAAVTLQNYVKRLRTVLGRGRDRIVTQPGGYMIRIEPAELDIAAMKETLAVAHGAARAGDWREAAAQASAALALWRGEPLCDVDLGMLAVPEVARLTELRFQARALQLEAGLQLGRHAEMVAEARQLTVETPLREHIHALLIRALHECSRKAEALEAYQHARNLLVEELGCEPGAELQALHREILDDSPVPVQAPGAAMAGSGGREPMSPDGQMVPVKICGAATPETAAGMPDAATVPRQLPAAVSHFTGRATEIDALTDMLCSADGARTVVICALAGAAGVGKTAVAVHWAHQVAEHFQDGQLYVNLRGYDPGEPVSAADALAGFLRALGVPGTEIPDDADQRSALYRSRLAGRRVLVMLDNARDGDQVRPLLPGDAGCAAVITSRDALAGLVVTDGARRLNLDVLPLADTVGLLRLLIGSRASEDHGAAVELARLCAQLPLALRIAAELAANRPHASLTELVAQLAEAQLDSLDAGEDRADVRAVFSWSLRQLPDAVAGAFAMIGLHPGEDLDAYACAALTGTTPAQASRVLSRLHRASLMQAAGPGRYGMHDLLRVYAREQAAASDIDGSCQQALTRLFDYYLAAAAAAMDIVFPAEAQQRPRISPAAAVVPEMAEEPDARTWLDRERANLVAVVVHCAGHSRGPHAARMAGTLFRYLMMGHHLPEALIVYSHALQAARRSGDRAAEAEALNGLGAVAGLKGRFKDAAGHYQAALECYRGCEDRAGEARVLNSLGITEQRLHNYQSAVGYHRQAIAAFYDAGDGFGAARALAELAFAETSLGLLDDAAEHLQRALPVFRDAKDQVREAQALSRIGELSLRRGQLAPAAGSFEQSLAIFRRTGHPTGIAAQLYNLGDVSLRQGKHQQAISYIRQALDRYRQAGDQYGETLTLRILAAALHGADQPAAARAELETALGLAAETGNNHEEATAHQDLAEIHHQAGEPERARHHWQQALDLYTQLGAPEADQIRSRLRHLA